MIAQTLKERRIITVSHQTVASLLEEYGISSRYFETSLDGKLKLKILIGKRLDVMTKIPIFVTSQTNEVLDLHLVDIGRISVIRSMLSEKWHLPVLQSLDLALYSLVSPYDVEVTQGPQSLAAQLSYELRNFLKRRKGKTKDLINQFLQSK